MPELSKLLSQKKVQTPLKGAFAANIASKAIATFAGQWPHSSYMIPGGVSVDPTNIDLLKAESYIEELIGFFEKETLGINIEDFLSFKSCKEFSQMDSDISFVENALIQLDMNHKGFAYDRFLILGKHSFSKPSKLKQTRAYNVENSYVNTEKSYSPNEKSYAFNAKYKDNYYETGPLARLMSNNTPIVKNMHRRFKDSAYSRVMARVFELANLLLESKNILKDIDISEKSYIKPDIDISKISSVGVGVVEAPRGPLLHHIDIKDGIIQNYKIITPTQFNIGSGDKQNPSPAQKSMIGMSRDDALFIFRTFDVCSVCTTH
jgi:Ni,Fe-hydrogenase I large subunit